MVNLKCSTQNNNHDLVIVLDLFQLISILLVLVFLFLGFKVLELKWSYKISKPHKWEEAIDHGKISNNIKKAM